MHRILVTGGAGYIGSQMVKLLLDRGHAVCTRDDLSSGRRDAILGGDFVRGSIGDAPLLERLFEERRFDAVMHFACFIQVGESVRDPAKYYANNIASTITLLNAMARAGIGTLVFSSSAAILGEPEACPVPENRPANPLHPYGISKWVVERMQVLDVAGRVTGKRIKANHAPRRPGDAAQLIADSTLARKRLGWRPRYAAWAWEQKLAAESGR